MGYFKKFSKVTIIIDNNYSDHSKYKVDLEHDWTELYSDAEEEIPHDMLKPMARVSRLTVYVDADLAHDQVTRRSIIGLLYS